MLLQRCNVGAGVYVKLIPSGLFVVGVEDGMPELGGGGPVGDLELAVDREHFVH